MIQPRIPFTKINLSGLVTMAQRLRDLIHQKHPSETFFEKVLEKLDRAIEMGTKATGSTQASAYTKHVQDADKDRDNSFDSLRNHIHAGLKRNHSAYREACERLYRIFKQNGLNLSRLPYSQETGALLSLFEDLGTTEAQEDLDTVHGREWLKELQDDQDAFEAIVSSRIAERSAEDIPTDAAAAGALIPALKALHKTMDVAEENELVDGIDDTITNCNNIIAEVVAASRR